MNEDPKIVRKDLGKILGISDVQALISTALSNYFTKGESDERYVLKDEPGTPSVTISVSNPTITVGQSTTETISLTAYNTTSISSVSLYKGSTKIVNGQSASGTTWSYSDDFTPDTAGQIKYRAEVVIDGETYTSNEATVTVEAAPVQYKNVFVGAGTEYSQVSFTDTGRQLSNNMVVEISNNDGEYLFIKVDKNNTVNNLYTVGAFEFSIALDAPVPVPDTDYKYYKSTNAQAAGTNVQYKINKV